MSAVRLENVDLRYRLATQKAQSFKEFTVHLLRGSLVYRDLWALRDVSFELEHGESLGIVGRNGAGKSTLLKVVAKILTPSSGGVWVQGGVAPILELGAGFDGELTGVENVYLNGMLLGRRRREIAERLDWIIDYSGLAGFADAALRSYSTGMAARLGFAVATAWRPDILILDEVLAVGDASFVELCEARVREFRDAGTTILFTSHDLERIRANCSRAIWIERGRICAAGPVEEVCGAYRQFLALGDHQVREDRAEPQASTDS